MNAPLPNDLSAFWIPFTANRSFKADPRMLATARDMHFETPEGRRILDGTAGLWCVNAGHCRPRIVEAIQKQAAILDFAPTFNLAHPLAFELAARVADLMPEGLEHVFFTNSGSESVETALKIALAYQRARGKGHKTRLIGRERGYHGVNFGGISVGGLPKNRMYFNNQLAQVDHLPHTHDLARNAFSSGQPEHGAELADGLERLVGLHDASTIAAVIVEPMAGSTGVLPPPKGYLERLRALCDKHDILLIFDEVITGYGRLGTPFAAQAFNVQPDLLTFAKAITNGTIPLGGVLVDRNVRDTILHSDSPAHAPEFLHGYTYSGHPMSCAVGLATLDAYASEGLFQRAAELAPIFEAAVHSLRGTPGVTDIRNTGLMAAVELAPVPGKPGLRGFTTFEHGFNNDILLRAAGDAISLAPPFISTADQIHSMVDSLRLAITAAQAAG